ncbi:pseudouridine synthase [Ferrimicrobium acidiphilum]|uniref:pseudouridine synthase n=1 Tax=Ferrimicrobium acidiphilum TaxID=121039 RepID=UPI003C6DAB5E|nr:rRNA pseudouridine synthase [Gammaproteobacteria bacterium]
MLAVRGYGSRRTAEGLIEAGRVTVNGEVARLGCRVIDADSVCVDGAPVGIAESLEYKLLNKPAGVVSTASDPHGRKTVVDLVPSVSRIYPVGRLDAESEGLLILTNDGPFADYLMHPRGGVEKEYLVAIDRRVTPQLLGALRRGIEVDGDLLVAKRVGQLSSQTLRIVLKQGKNRQIRRMVTACGFEVTRLVRTRIGSLADPSLAPGQSRDISTAELIALRSGGRSIR